MQRLERAVLARRGGRTLLRGRIRDRHARVRHCGALLIGDRADHAARRVLRVRGARGEEQKSENTYTSE